MRKRDKETENKRDKEERDQIADKKYIEIACLCKGRKEQGRRVKKWRKTAYRQRDEGRARSKNDTFATANYIFDIRTHRSRTIMQSRLQRFTPCDRDGRGIIPPSRRE